MTNLSEAFETVLREHPNELYYGRPMLESVISLLNADSQFNVFFDHCHQLGDFSGICFNSEPKFPNQVLRRAKEVGVSQAIAEVLAYVNSSDVRIECALLLYRVHVDEEFTLDYEDYH